MDINIQKNKIIITNFDEEFDVKATLECGQIFSYKQLSINKYIVISGNKSAVIEYDNKQIIVLTKDTNYFYNFFDLDRDYKKIKQDLIINNPDIKKFVLNGNGIRILRQEPIQTIISFIVSANNNIKRIKNILFKISQQYGEQLENCEEYSFPTLKQLSVATKEDFDRLGAGYRSQYLCDSILLLLSDNFNLNKIKNLPTEELKQKLMILKGVGPKVADCILLFGFSRTEVCPVDTWMRKAYFLFESKKLSEQNISKYFSNKFGNLSGFAQQYIYNYMLNFYS